MLKFAWREPDSNPTRAAWVVQTSLAGPKEYVEAEVQGEENPLKLVDPGVFFAVIPGRSRACWPGTSQALDALKNPANVHRSKLAEARYFTNDDRFDQCLAIDLS